MAQSVVLITGTSSGIGLAVAVSLALDANKNYIVYATMRNLAKRGELEKEVGSALNNTLFIRELDVTKEHTIVEVVAELKEKYGRIDCLVNNAGMGMMMIFEVTAMQEMRDVMEVNFFGAVRVMQEVIPLMKQKEKGRIINMSSLAGIYGYGFLEAYSASKFALEAVTEGLAVQLKPFGISVSSIQPGPIHTKISQNMLFHEDHMMDERVDAKTKAMFGAVTGHMKNILGAGVAFPVEKVVDTVRQILTDEKPHVRYRCSGLLPFEKTKYKDEDGDEYVKTVLQMFNM